MNSVDKGKAGYIKNIVVYIEYFTTKIVVETVGGFLVFIFYLVIFLF